MDPIRRATLASASLACVTAALPAAAQIGGTNGLTEIASLDSSGQFAALFSERPSISEDGNWVAFSSYAALLPEDTNMQRDIYVLDRSTGDLVCASTTAAGAYGNIGSDRSHISADGRWVVFETLASNLVGLDTNGAYDVVRKDLWTGAIERVSNAHLSPFSADASSMRPTVSNDGRFVAFESSATDLIASDTNLEQDVFVRDMQLGVTYRLSEGPLGEGNGASGEPHISGDGTRVAFESDATNLVVFDPNDTTDVFVGEIGLNPALLSVDLFGFPSNGASYDASISSDGSTVAFTSLASDLVLADANGLADVFVLDVDTLAREMASVTTAGVQTAAATYSGELSRTGEAVAMVSVGQLAPFATGVPQVFVRDLTTDATWLASRPDGVAGAADLLALEPALAQGGAVVAFKSLAATLVPGDTNDEEDIFVRTALPDPIGYCTPTITLQGCQPLLTSNGFPSATGASAFHLIGDDLPNQRNGLVFYGFGGRASNPWAGSTMCINGTKKRTPLLNTLGNPPAADDCSGYFAFDVDAFIAGSLGGNPAPGLTVVGQAVNTQFWGRQGPNGTYLTTAVEYVVGP